MSSETGQVDAVTSRAEALHQQHYSETCRQTDRLFAGLMVFQWLAALAIVLWISPETWQGEAGAILPEVRLDAFLGVGIMLLTGGMVYISAGSVWTRHVVACSQMAMCALLIHMTGGRLGTHFHLLGSLAFLAFYRDWRVLATASLVTLADALVRGSVWPETMRVASAAGSWNGLELGGWIAVADIFLIRSCILGVREMRRSARRQAEAEFAGERHYEDLVNSVDLVVWEADARTHEFTFVSRHAGKLLGCPSADWLGDPGFLKSRLHPADRPRVMAFRSAELSFSEPHAIEYRLMRPDGGSVWVRDAATAAVLKGGRLVRRGVMENVTERKRIEQVKSEFVSMVSHELRTPLTSIHGSLGLVVGGMAGTLPPRAKSLVEVAHRNSERLTRLIGDILDLERIEAGKLSLVFQPVAIADVIRQTIEANRAYGSKFGVRFAVGASLPDARVRGDSDRLTQVLTNFISNAAKFSPAGGTVTVSAARQAGSIRVSVRDHGPGIPEEFRSRIFQRFSQADGTARRKGGSGLGLSIAKSIVEVHGGKVGFETEPGAGTVFWFELPELADADASGTWVGRATVRTFRPLVEPA
jgi:PAS domain S-box-containing protein